MNDDRRDSFEKGYQQGLQNAIQTSGGAAISAKIGGEYCDKIKAAIEECNSLMNNNLKDKNTAIQQLRGYGQEYMHVGSFNIDAAMQDRSDRAQLVGSNKTASVDIMVEGVPYSSKCGDNAIKTADGQSIDLYKKLQQDCPKKEPFESYKTKKLRELGLDPNLSDEELQSIPAYKDQKRLCPTDQTKDAKEYLKRGAEKNRRTPGKEHFAGDKEETANEICDTVKSKDGKVSSKKFTREEIEKATEDGRKGEFDARKYGMGAETTNYEYILKKSCKIGRRAAIVAGAISVLPYVFQMLVDEGFSFDDFKNMCETGATSSIEGFLQGSISAGISISCQLGKFGEVLKNANPEMTAYAAGAITAIAIHTMKNAYLVAMKKKQSRELVNDLISDTFISAGGMIGGALVSFIPIPFVGYFLGSAIGSILASFVYKKCYSATIGLCTEHGYTLWGLVEQDYTVPAEILREIGFDVVEFDRVELKKVELHKLEPKRVYPKTINPDTLDVVFLRRGVIGVNKIGYVF